MKVSMTKLTVRNVFNTYLECLLNGINVRVASLWSNGMLGQMVKNRNPQQRIITTGQLFEEPVRH